MVPIPIKPLPVNNSTINRQILKITKNLAYGIPVQSASAISIPLKASFPRHENLKILTPIPKKMFPRSIIRILFHPIRFKYCFIITLISPFCRSSQIIQNSSSYINKMFIGGMFFCTVTYAVLCYIIKYND